MESMGLHGRLTEPHFNKIECFCDPVLFYPFMDVFAELSVGPWHKKGRNLREDVWSPCLIRHNFHEHTFWERNFFNGVQLSVQE